MASKYAEILHSDEKDEIFQTFESDLQELVERYDTSFATSYFKDNIDIKKIRNASKPTKESDEEVDLTPKNSKKVIKKSEPITIPEIPKQSVSERVKSLAGKRVTQVVNKKSTYVPSDDEDSDEQEDNKSISGEDSETIDKLVKKHAPRARKRPITLTADVDVGPVKQKREYTSEGHKLLGIFKSKQYMKYVEQSYSKGLVPSHSTFLRLACSKWKTMDMNDRRNPDQYIDWLN
jgi:hypothetical protein